MTGRTPGPSAIDAYSHERRASQGKHMETNPVNRPESGAVVSFVLPLVRPS
jgi:hypothetical protein